MTRDVNSSCRPLRHRFAAFFLAVWFVLLAAAVPRPVHAIPTETIIVQDLPAQIREQVTQRLRDSWGFQAQVAVINALTFFTERFAYETAVWLASGGKAQSPLFNRETALNFLADSALGAGLQFVDEMDKFAAGQLGFDGPFGVAQFICSPTIPSIKLKLKLGLVDRLERKQPICTWNQLSGNWDAFTQGGFGATLSRSLSQTGIAFEPGQSDLSAGLELHIGLGEKQAQVAFTKLNESLANKGFRPLGEKISGLTKTPASVAEAKINEEIATKSLKDQRWVAANTADAIGDISTFVPMLEAAGKALAINFAVTLVSQTLQQQVLNKGLFLGDANAGLGGTEESAAPPAAREQQARTAFAELQRPRFVSSGDYDQLTELASCDPQHRQLTSCAMDDGFVQAVRRAQTGAPITVAEAITEGLLHADWPLIKVGTAKDQDPNCSKGPPTGGYCASNLQKLRRARIIPIGWELAANHEANSAADPVRLSQVIDAFHRNGIDGICGDTDAEESPYCGLIDPNWVLTYPIQQCQLRGPGELLIESGTAIRAESCVDAPSCLERDAEGKCVGGYGYCVREKNIWHPAGQSCPGQYASCRAFSSREGAALAVLTSTIDRSVCTAENAGCRWYSSSRDAAGNWESGSRRYLNRLAEQCTEANEGCTELIPTKSARRNLIDNPSFERGASGQPIGWTLGSETTYSTDGSDAIDGSAAVRVKYDPDPNAGPGFGAYTAQYGAPIPASGGSIPVSGDRTYVLSASAKRPSGVTNNQLRVHLKLFDSADGAVPIAGMRTSCNTSVGRDPNAGDGGHANGIGLYVNPTDTSAGTGSCWFQVPTTAAEVALFAMSTTVDPIIVDAIQLEEGEAPTAFHEGYDTNASRTYLKVASPDLRCYDVGGDGQLNTANDHASCPSFAAGCTEADVGCERFTPADGSPTVNGQFSDIDRCPVACVGYAAFREVASAFDRKATFDFFIPSTARQCSAAEIGCSEFTNMDALERGGEQREYFSQLRRCEKPGEATSATYYTWEGSDTQGYQLRSFVLQRESGDAASAPPAVFGYGAGADLEPNCGPAPGTDHYGKRPTDAGYDSVITPDCRAFYSQNGDINYRRLSRTILITDDCVRYRASHQVDSGTCDFAGGEFSATAGCTIKGHRQESQQCQAASAGCRAYRGNAGGAIQTIIATDFEVTDGDARQGWSLGTQSAESLIVGGHSFWLTGGQTGEYPLRARQTGLTSEQCTSQGGTFTAEAAAPSAASMSASDCAAVGGTHDATAGTCAHPDFCTLPHLRAGGTYELIVVGKGTAQIEVRLRQGTGGATDLIDSSVAVGRRQATLTPTWQRVVIGPLILAPALVPTVDASLWITATGGSVFLDSVLFREVPQLTTVIKGSWRTPQACDLASIADNAAPLAQGMLGCRAYQMRTGGTETLRSFSRLCRAEVVGCTAFHDTRNSADLGIQTFNNPPSDPSNNDDVTVPADTIRYLVDDRAKYCQAAAKGCARFGKPTLDRTADVADARENPPATDWADAFLLDQPDRYTGPGAILCEHPSLFCEEYRGQDGTVIYFKDPGNRTCEYRENVIMNGTPYSGWFQSGSDPPAACDPRLLIGGSQYGIWRNADIAASGQAVKYDGWAGLCQAGFDHCTEFVDPTDRTPAHPNGQPYHAIRTTVDFASCQGGVSQKEGCVVLSDASDPSMRFSAAVSLGESDLRQGARVPAINCDANPAGCKRCVVERKCRADDGHVQGTRAGEPPLPPGAPTICLSDSDCGDGVPAGFRCRGGEVEGTCQTSSDCRGWVSEPLRAALGFPICQQFANDGNAIVKVQRDRSCGQWLACRSATEAQDPSLNRSIEVCESIDLCESYRTAEGGSTALRCSRWVRGEETQGKILTRSLYQGRNRGWTGQEFSGYSIVGTYQPHELVPVDVSMFRDKIDQRLVYIDPNCWGTVSTPASDPNAPVAPIRSCKRISDGEEVEDPPGQCDGLPTTPDIPATPYVDGRLPTKCGVDGKGLCVSHKCVYGANGTTLAGIGTVTGPSAAVALPVQCRVYPEVDSPFDAAVAEFKEVSISHESGGPPSDEVHVRTASLPGYEGANVCERRDDRELAACGCLYNKIKYGGETKYFSMRDRDIPNGFCDGGFGRNEHSKAGVLRCQSDADCDDERSFDVDLARAVARCGGAGASGCKESAGAQIAAQREHGKCKLDERRERFFGLTGICLERDQSIAIDGDPSKHPCVSWYPVQQLAGGVDLFNQYELAGFHDEAQYCIETKRYEYRKNIEGMRIDACDLASALGCAGLSGGAALGECITAIGLNNPARMASLCQGDSNYEVFDWEADWVDGFTDWPTLCPPWFDVTLHCKPKGGTGWYPDPYPSGFLGGGDSGYPEGDDNDSPAGPEEEAFRCTQVLDVANEPVPGTGQTGNIAWTDRVRPRANLEEELVVAASQVDPERPQHPNRYTSSCRVFGQISPDIDPETVNGESAGQKYLEVFPDAHPLSSAPETCAPGWLTTNSPEDGPFPEVAAARRHYQTIVEGATELAGGRTVQALQGLFAKTQKLWRWHSTTEARWCDASSGTAKQGDDCTRDGQCQEAGSCRGICRMVVGRCKVQIGAALGGTAVYAAEGNVCTLATQATQCGSGGECWLMRGVCGDSATRCSSNNDCAAGVTCRLPTGVCAGGTGAVCTSDAGCTGTTGPCLFPILPIGSDADGGIKPCTRTDQCGADHNPNDSTADGNHDPDGVCQPGCWNASAKGERCDGTLEQEGSDLANSQCAFSGQCVPIQADRVREDTGEFEERPPPVSTWTPIQREGAAGASSAPKIASIGTCAQLGGCTVGKLDRFTVNELDGSEPPGEVRAAGGLVTIRFFGWAHRNQMPLIEAKVDWGDGSPVSGGTGKYQNHKPYCATGEDLSTSIFRCSTATELTCQTNADCPTGAGTCQGQFCRMGCDADTDCPLPAACDENTQTCVRGAGQKLCLLSLGTGAAAECAQSSDCAGAGNECVDVGGTPIHIKQTSCSPPADPTSPPTPAELCTINIGGTTYNEDENRCVGETSFGNFPDACSPTPFTFRHTYRCDGVNDPNWNLGNPNANGCVFKPKVKLRDNWYWCTGTPAGGGSPQGTDFCDDKLEAWVEFSGQVIVSG